MIRSSVRTLRIRQANDLNFSTAASTSPIPPYPSMLRRWAIFMKLRAPEALEDRPRKTMAGPTAKLVDHVTDWPNGPEGIVKL